MPFIRLFAGQGPRVRAFASSCVSSVFLALLLASCAGPVVEPDGRHVPAAADTPAAGPSDLPASRADTAASVEEETESTPPLSLTSPVIALHGATSPSGSIVYVKIYNVGQGNCVLVKFPNGNHMLVDCGTTSSSTNKAGIVSAIVSDSGGVIDTVVLTHPDADHVNLVPAILKALPTGHVPSTVHISQNTSAYKGDMKKWLDTKPAATKIITYPANYAGTAGPDPNFASGSTEVWVMAANVSGDANTKSIVLSIDTAGANMLLTGDATMATEVFILSTWPAHSYVSTLVLFGHHGSNHSSSPEFVKKTTSHVGVFSASASNKRYGHPRCTVLKLASPELDKDGVNGKTISQHSVRCWNAATKTYDTTKNRVGMFLTATQGNIVFSVDKKGKYQVVVDKLN